MESKTFLPFENKLSSRHFECYHLKTLIPNDVIGSIIGKKGSVVMHLEKTFNVKIAISCSGEMYPGSDDRVCLLSGDFDRILSVNDFIMMQVHKMSDTGSNVCFDYDRKMHFGRSKQVKFLIPELSVLKIIGRHGAVIKRMKSLSGSFIQISQPSPKVRLFERCIIVAGDLESNKRACRMIFDKIADDTTMPFYKNINYSKVYCAIPSAFPTGSALAGIGYIPAMIEAAKEMGESCDTSSYTGDGFAPSKYQSEFLEAAEMILREKAYSEPVIKKAKEAFFFLIYHDILNACSSVIMKSFQSAPSSFAKSADSKINMASNARERNFVFFNDTPLIGIAFSDAPNRHENMNDPENFASSFSSGRNQDDDDDALNYMPLWNRLPNPFSCNK